MRLVVMAIWRMRQVWLGLAPVYVRAFFIALFSGPNHKPAYRVTRKTNRFRWYWRETLIQSGLFVLLVIALIFHVATTPSLAKFELGLVGWCLFHLTILGGFVRRSWFGVSWQRAPRPQRATAPASAEAITVKLTTPPSAD